MGRHAKPSGNPLASGKFWAAIGVILVVAVTAGVTTYFVWPRGGEGAAVKPKRPSVTKEELLAGYREGKLKGILPKFAAYVAAHKDDYDIRALYASVLVLTGDLETAVKEYKAVIEKRPEDADALYQAGVAMGQLGRTKDAIDFVGRATRIKPGIVVYQTELARLLSKDGQHDAALGAWQQVLSLTPEGDRYRGTIYAEMAAVYVAKGQPSEAAAIIDSGLRIDPENEYLKALSSQISTTLPTTPSAGRSSGRR